MQIVCACGDFDGHGLAAVTYQLGGGFHVTSKSNFSYDPSIGLIPAGEWIVAARNYSTELDSQEWTVTL